MAEFDLAEARKHYSDQEISDYILGGMGGRFDVQEARKHYDDQEILQHFGLTPGSQAPVPTPQPTAAAPAPVSTGRYILGRGAASALDVGQGLAESSLLEAGMLPEAGEIAAQGLPSQQPAVKQMLFGTPTPVPGGPVARYGGAVASAVGANPLLAAAFPAATVGGALGGEAGAELYPGSTAAPIVGSLIGGAGAGGATNLIGRGINALTGEVNPAASRFAAAGIPSRSAALTSENPLTKSTLLPAAPVEATQADLGSAVERVAAAKGASRTPQQAGEFAQDSARTWLSKTLPAKVETAFEPVNSAMPKNEPVPLNNYKEALESMTEKGGVLQPSIKALTPTLPAKLLKALPGEEASPEVLGELGFSEEEIAQARGILEGSSKGAPTWQEVRSLKKAVGNALSNPSVLRDIPAEQLDRLYAALSEDQRAATMAVDARAAYEGGQAGGRVTAAFDEANAEASRLYQLAEKTVSKIVSGKKPSSADPKPEDVAARLLSAGKRGGSDLQALRAEMPEVADELAAAHIRQLGLLDPADVTSPVHGSFPGRWASLSPEAKSALFPVQQERSALDAVAGIGQQLKTVKPPKAGPGALHALVGGGVGSALGALAGGAIDVTLGQAANLSSATGAEIAGAASGELMGTAVPYLGSVARQAAARNVLLAKLAGARRSGLPLSLQAPVGAAAGVNALSPGR